MSTGIRLWRLAVAFAGLGCALAVQAQVCGNPGQDGNQNALGGIVNRYYPSPAAGTVTVPAGTLNTCIPVNSAGAIGAAGGIAANDLLLVIQMQAGQYRSENNDDYGQNTNAANGTTSDQNVGAYEFVIARGDLGTNGCAAGSVPIRGAGANNGLINSYVRSDPDLTTTGNATVQGRRRYQVIEVPQYRNVTLGAQLQAAYWNGEAGGVVVVDSVGRFSLGNNPGVVMVSATGRGFRGGGAQQYAGDAGLADTDYRTLSSDTAHASKGEGIVGTPRFVYDLPSNTVINTGVEGYNQGSFARGAPGNAGGGGNDGNPVANDQNAGGGGGGNGGVGGTGGNAWFSNEAVGGIGGDDFGSLAYTRLVMGGGGGAGTRNNSTGSQSSGGTGGGIVIIRAAYFQGNGIIEANGNTGPAPANDSGGGGGAGGTIVLRNDPTSAFNVYSGITVRANGGNGADAWITEPPGVFPGARHGPGGGGAGGVIWLGNTMTGFAAVQVNGGANGRTTTALDAYGAGGGAGYTGTTAYTGPLPGADPGYICVTTPVTLAAFEARAQGAGTAVAFATSTEVDNVAFRLYEGALGEAAIGPAYVPGAGHSTEPQRYTLTLPRAPRDGTLWLADFDTRGTRTMHGPFAVGALHGAWPADQGFDWTLARSQAQAQRTLATLAAGATAARIDVARAGFQRVRFEDLAALGIALDGVPVAALAVTLRDQPVPRRVESADAVFGPGDVIEFHGEPRTDLYGPTQAYVLEADSTRALEIAEDARAPGAPLAAWTWAQARHDPQRQYNFAARRDDPWYAERLLAFRDAPAQVSVPLAVHAPAAIGVAGSLSLALEGVTQWEGEALDHHLQVSFAGRTLPALRADGLVALDYEASVPAAALAQGDGALVLTLPGDTGYDFDLMHLDAAVLRYPARPVAREGVFAAGALQTQPPSAPLGSGPPTSGALTLFADSFETGATVAGEASLAIAGLPDAPLRAYRRDGGAWTLLRDVRRDAAGITYVAGPRSADHAWWIGTADAMQRPAVTALAARVAPSAQPADLLVITHPAFVQALEPLLERRRSQGLRVRVVDVEQLYRHRTGANPDPDAVAGYVRESAARGTRYVLIVGADHYDYGNVLGTGAVSFVPTPYVAVNEVARFSPSDARYGDVDGDGVPDLTVGRLPVRTAVELEALVAKILAYESGTARTALLVSGATDSGGRFRTGSEAFGESLPGDWSLSRAHVDDLGAAGARQALLQQFGGGPAIVDFYGHSAPGQWTFDPIFTAADVAGLANQNQPALVLQWGCWNAYFVAPQANTLAHALLLGGRNGAAALLGAATLAGVDSHEALAGELHPRLGDGRRLGDALLQARRALAAAGRAHPESMLGVGLLGDPSMPLR